MNITPILLPAQSTLWRRTLNCLFASFAFCASGLLAEPLTDWEPVRGTSGDYTGLDSNAPVFGDGTPGSAAEKGVFASFDEISLTTPGDRLEISGVMEIDLESISQNQLRLGLFHDPTSSGNEGWAGYQGANSAGQTNGILTHRTYVLQGPFWGQAGANAAIPRTTGSSAITSGRYDLSIAVEARDSGVMRVDWILAGQAPGGYRQAFVYLDDSDDAVAIFNRVGLFSGGGVNASKIAFADLAVTFTPAAEPVPPPAGDPLTDWEIFRGTNFTGLDTANPIIGDWNNGSAIEHAISAGFDRVTLERPGDKAIFRGNFYVFLESAGYDQFRWGLFDDNDSEDSTGWAGYLGGNSTGSNNSTAGFLSKRTRTTAGNWIAHTGGLVARANVTGPTSLATGTYEIVFSVEREQAGVVRVDWILTGDENYGHLHVGTYLDTTEEPQYTFNRAGLFTGGGFDAARVEFQNLSLAFVSGPEEPAPPKIAIRADGADAVILSVEATPSSSVTIEYSVDLNNWSSAKSKPTAPAWAKSPIPTHPPLPAASTAPPIFDGFRLCNPKNVPIRKRAMKCSRPNVNTCAI